MIISAGPCLINDNPREIENAIKTAKALQVVDPDIWFRAKLWGGGLTPDIYYPGIQTKGVPVLATIRKCGITVGTEVQCSQRLPLVQFAVDYIWLAARVMQSYGVLEEIGHYASSFRRVIIKRHFGATEAETLGIYDICREKHGYAPIICERGVNSFDRPGQSRWIPDFRFMANVLRERPDINLMFDVSHASFCAENVFPFVRAAYELGVRNFMLEVYADVKATQTDQAHALSIEQFKIIHDWLKRREYAQGA